MKYFLLVLTIVLTLAIASCTCGSAGPTGSAEAETPTGGDLSAGSGSGTNDANGTASVDTPDQKPQDEAKDEPDFNFSFTKAFASMCGDAVKAADDHIQGTAAPEDTQQKLYDISGKMVAELDNQPAGDATNAGTAAIMLVMSLHDSVNKNSAEDVEQFKTWRDALEKLSKA